MAKRIAVLLANGFEEIEAVTAVDVLRRAALEVEILGVGASAPVGAHSMSMAADRLLATADVDVHWDAVILPGGMPGASTLRDHAVVQELLIRQAQRRGWLAAICAGPIALAQAGVLASHKATCFPGFEPVLTKAGAKIDTEGLPVVVDDRIITSRGVGTALDFALEVVAQLVTRDAAKALAARMLVK